MEALDFYQTGFCYRSGAPEKRLPNVDPIKQEPFVVEEFLDFSNDEDHVAMADVKLTPPAFDGCHGLNSAESSSVTAVDSCNGCNENSFSEPHVMGEIGQRSLLDRSFAGELCVPHDDLAELEWLSTLQEESFSSEDMQNLQLISGMAARADIEPNKPNSSFRPEMPVPGKARSKRSRAAPGNWASHLLVLSPTTSTSENERPLSPKTVTKRKDGRDRDRHAPSDGRKCLHCATDKTPQWRTGPMGPKTLCNACGVRYKSGRLVPEYRPAASPTFVLTKHSNSHRKVLELRRQKEMHHRQPQPHHLHHHHQHHFLHQSLIYDMSNGEDYLIHQHTGPDYRQLI
uniref:GATA transcription factor n=1 Tax=Kalanchoe fedtschenkoi TaxID=63787 RepID=A0A7N0UB22_KALFE